METQISTETGRGRRARKPEHYSKKNRFIWLAFGVSIGIILCRAFEVVMDVSGGI